MKTAVITGASSGIGFAASAELIQKGYRIIGIGHDPARCEEADVRLEQAKARRGANGSTVDGNFGEVGNRQFAKLRRGRKVARVVGRQALGHCHLRQQAAGGRRSQQGRAEKAAAGRGAQRRSGAAFHGVYPGAGAGILRSSVFIIAALGHFSLACPAAAGCRNVGKSNTGSACQPALFPAARESA